MDQNCKNQLPVFDRYAIFQTGGKQYQAIEGKTIAIEKLDAQVGDTVFFDEVLICKLDKDTVHIGQPFLKTRIKAEIVRQDKGPKVISFHFKRRKMSRVKRGHRQPITVVRITSFEN